MRYDRHDGGAHAGHVLKPWGWYEVIWDQTEPVNYQVKVLTVEPYQSLSLQSHRYRSEHWLVLHGEALVTYQTKYEVGTVSVRQTTLSKGGSIDIPLGARHRLENPKAASPLVVLEVEQGTIILEEDITRHADVYGRA